MSPFVPASSPGSPARAALPVALVVGGTGLVGGHLIERLLREPAVGVVRALLRRRPAGLSHPKLQIEVVNFDRLENHAKALAADWVFSALGTTLAKAGSRAAFRQVDFDYPLQVAQLAKAQGAQRFQLVSAVGANARSPVFYNRVKGELEEAVKALGFDSTTLAQPSLLAGDRGETRLAERAGLALGWLLPQRWRPVQAWQVAQGLIDAAKAGQPGVRILSNADMRRIH